MAKKTQDNKEELEQLTATENFFEKYKKIIFVVGGGLIIIVLGFVGYQKFVTEPKIEEAQDAYWPAFYEWQFADTTELAYEGNENFLGFADIASEYSGTPAGDIANYAMGVHTMEKGEFDVAISYFEDCDFDDIMIGSLTIGLIGDCYVELQDYETAAEKFQEAADREPNEFTSPMFLKKLGLVYEAIGDKELAVEAYTKIKDDWSESVTASDIDKYIARAEG